MFWRQGDLFVETIRTIPDGAVPQAGVVLAEGEITGHCHRIEDSRSAQLFVYQGQLLLNVVTPEARLVHDEHGPIELARGAYRVWRQREYSPVAPRIDHRVRLTEALAMWPFGTLFRWSPEAARPRILAGRAPRGLRVRGALRLANSPALARLPDRLSAASIDISDCPQLAALPAGLRCQELTANRTPIETLPDDLRVTWALRAASCQRLRRLPALRLDTLVLRGCGRLERLPPGLIVRRLDLARCRRLQSLPDETALMVSHLDLSGCANLKALPERFGRLQTLDVSGCSSLVELPLGMRLRGSIELADSGLRALPWSLRSARLLWRGVPVTEDIAFAPEKITIADILGERNAALRQVLLERVGLARFVDEAGATVVDQDHDAGGERRLLRIAVDGAEDIVCVQVSCPSTAKCYLLRVPPDMYSCQQAVAWTAGFRNPDSYRPFAET